MDVGIGVFPSEAVVSGERLAEACEKAEEFGFSRVWLAESQGIWPDPYAVLGRISERTSRIGLGVGVSNPQTRHPAVLARAAVTLSQLSGGRFVLGVGAGNTSLLHLGLSPATVNQCGDAVRCIRSLIQGEDGSFCGQPVPAFRNYEPLNVPVYLAANGPKMLTLAGRVSDGAIVSSGITPEILDWVWTHLDVGLKRSDRDRSQFRLITFVGCATSEDRAQARRQILPWVARRLSMPLPPEVSGVAEADRRRALECYDYSEHYRVGASHGGVVDSIPDEWIDRFAIAGRPDECLERMKALSTLKVDEVFLLPMTDGPFGLMRTFAERILPKLGP